MKYTVDSNILIYMLEAHPHFGSAALEIMEQLEARGDGIGVSQLVFAEASAHPKMSDAQAAATCERIHQMELIVQPVNEIILRLAGKLRRDHRLKLADAIHLASAFEMKAAYFITNDLQLIKKNVTGLKIVGLKDYGKI